MSSVGLNETEPSWPSLYDPGIELLRIAGKKPVQPGGAYLSHPIEIFRFTLYWTLIFYTPIFLCCGLYAFLNLTFPPTRRPPVSRRETSASEDLTNNYIGLQPYSPRGDAAAPLLRPPKPKPNQKRSRTTFAILVLLAFLLLSIAGACLSSAIVGFILTGVYKLAKFNMSTWIPFLWSLISALVGLLSIWPTFVDII